MTEPDDRDEFSLALGAVAAWSLGERGLFLILLGLELATWGVDEWTRPPVEEA